MDAEISGWSLADLAQLVGATIEHGPGPRIIRPVPAGYSDPHGITFAEGAKFFPLVRDSNVGAVILSKDAPDLGIPTLRTEKPRVAFGMVLGLAQRPLPLAPEIHPTASIDGSAQVDPSARIGAHCVVERGAEIGAGAIIHPFGYVGENCRVGARSILYPRVTLYQDVVVGEQCVIHAGTVIGADGFGFQWDGTKQVKVPQVGGVILEDGVEIGANSCIDRATCGETVLRKGVKLDNLVQVGHNAEIGEHTVIAGLTAVAGSVKIGARNTVGGQSGFADHTIVCDGNYFGGRTAIMQDIEKPGVYFGFPAIPHRDAMRVLAVQKRLPELLDRIKELEKRIGISEAE